MSSLPSLEKQLYLWNNESAASADASVEALKLYHMLSLLALALKLYHMLSLLNC